MSGPDYSKKDWHVFNLSQLHNPYRLLATEYAGRRVETQHDQHVLDCPQHCATTYSVVYLSGVTVTGTQFSTNNRPSCHNPVTTMIACIQASPTRP